MYIENKYQRWIKTKPKTNDRHKAALGVIDRFIEDGRLIKVLVDNSDSNSDEQNGNVISSTGDDFKIRLPGVAFNKVLKDYGKEFFESKGLSPQDSDFMAEISPHCLRAIKKGSLVKVIANNGKIISLDRKNREVVINKLNELIRKEALILGESQKWNMLLLNPDWLKELEDGYEKYKLTHDVEDEHVENEASKEDDSNDRNWIQEQNEQNFEPWQDEPNDSWGRIQ
jgi:hypothetical protein